MTADRRSVLLGAAAATFAAAAQAQTAAPAVPGAPSASAWPRPSEVIDLWPKGAPGMPVRPPVETVTERSPDSALHDRAVVGITKPRLAVFRPWQSNGAAILVTPGGGYLRVVIDREGYEIADYFVARGFTVFVLFYRLPGEGWAAGPNVALSDAQRAMRIIRHRASEFGVDPQRVCAMGFSAGGHLCADLATRYDAKVYAPVDAADAQSARPLVAAPIYPVISMTPPTAHAGSRTKLLGDNPTPESEAAHSPHRNVTAKTPPCFIVHAEDDGSVPVENALLMRGALKAAKVPCETHLFVEGGHGFGIRKAIGKPVGLWPELFLAWARTQGVLGG